MRVKVSFPSAPAAGSPHVVFMVVSRRFLNWFGQSIGWTGDHLELMDRRRPGGDQRCADQSAAEGTQSRAECPGVFSS
jgi:hypothetical protein